MMGMMPGYLADPECFGVKLVSLIPRNKPPQYSSHLGLVLLFEAEHGSRWRCSMPLKSPPFALPLPADWLRGFWRAKTRRPGVAGSGGTGSQPS